MMSRHHHDGTRKREPASLCQIAVRKGTEIGGPHESVLWGTCGKPSRGRRGLKAVKIELKARMHEPSPTVGKYLRAVVLGHVRYYGVPTNGPAIGAFRRAIGRL